MGEYTDELRASYHGPRDQRYDALVTRQESVFKDFDARITRCEAAISRIIQILNGGPQHDPEDPE